VVLRLGERGIDVGSQRAGEGQRIDVVHRQGGTRGHVAGQGSGGVEVVGQIQRAAAGAIDGDVDGVDVVQLRTDTGIVELHVAHRAIDAFVQRDGNGAGRGAGHVDRGVDGGVVGRCGSNGGTVRVPVGIQRFNRGQGNGFRTRQVLQGVCGRIAFKTVGSNGLFRRGVDDRRLVRKIDGGQPGEFGNVDRVVCGLGIGGLTRNTFVSYPAIGIVVAIVGDDHTGANRIDGLLQFFINRLCGHEVQCLDIHHAVSIGSIARNQVGNHGITLDRQGVGTRTAIDLACNEGGDSRTLVGQIGRSGWSSPSPSST